MQSVVSLMSIGKIDIGNLEDLEEDDESGSQVRDDVSVSTYNQISNITSQINQLNAHSGNPFEEEGPEHDPLNPFGIAVFSFFVEVFFAYHVCIFCNVL